MICPKCKLNDLPSNSTKKWCKQCRVEARQAWQQYRKTHPKNKYNGKTYSSRDFLLKEIGFESYRDYLKSALWQRIRAKVFRVKGRNCYLCNGVAYEVHHNRYHQNDLLGKTLRYLFPICRPCHERLEFSKHGNKVELHIAKDLFQQRSKWLNNLILQQDAEQ